MKLKNFFAKASALAVALSMTLGIAACNNKPAPGRTYNNETDTLVFSTLEVDGVFNPFFSTSGTDSSVVGMTQIGMLTNDKDGKVAYGDGSRNEIRRRNRHHYILFRAEKQRKIFQRLLSVDERRTV